MTEEQIQKLAEQEYPVTTQTMYNEVDDIYVDIDLSEPFREAFIEGYKAAMLQGMGWVKVSERTPNKTGEYVVKNENGVVGKCVFSVPRSRINETWERLNITEWLDESMLQNKGEWISDAIEFAKWIHKNYNPVNGIKWVRRFTGMKNYTTDQIYKEFTSSRTNSNPIK